MPLIQPANLHLRLLRRVGYAKIEAMPAGAGLFPFEKFQHPRQDRLLALALEMEQVTHSLD